MTTEPNANPTESASPERMPADLKARGWKLEKKIVNDDEENPDYIARNEMLGLSTEPFPLVSRAIAEARKLDAGNGAAPGTSVQIVDVPLSKLRLDGGTQPREDLDLAVLDRYAEAMLANLEINAPYAFPPVVVFHDGKNYWLADGFHRLFAYKKAFPTVATMLAELRQGTQRDAILYSLGANALHGLPRSNEDKRRAVQTLLEDPEWSTWSDNVLAGKANVSQPFVSSLRRELIQRMEATRKDVIKPCSQCGKLIEVNVHQGDEVKAEFIGPNGECFKCFYKKDDKPKAAAVRVSKAAPAPTTARTGRDGVIRETKNIGQKPKASPPAKKIEARDETKTADRAFELAGNELHHQAAVELDRVLKRGTSLDEVARHFLSMSLQLGDEIVNKSIAARLGVLNTKSKAWDAGSRALESYAKNAHAPEIFALTLELDFRMDHYGTNLDNNQKRIFKLFPRVGDFKKYLDRAREELKPKPKPFPKGKMILSAEEFEKLSSSYSADIIFATKGKTNVKKPFEFEGRQLIATAALHLPNGGRECEAYEIFPKSEFKGALKTKLTPGSGYNGVAVTWKNEKYVLRGPKLIFKCEPQRKPKTKAARAGK